MRQAGIEELAQKAVHLRLFVRLAHLRVRIAVLGREQALALELDDLRAAGIVVQPHLDARFADALGGVAPFRGSAPFRHRPLAEEPLPERDDRRVAALLRHFHGDLRRDVAVRHEELPPLALAQAWQQPHEAQVVAVALRQVRAQVDVVAPQAPRLPMCKRLAGGLHPRRRFPR